MPIPFLFNLFSLLRHPFYLCILSLFHPMQGCLATIIPHNHLPLRQEAELSLVQKVPLSPQV